MARSATGGGLTWPDYAVLVPRPRRAGRHRAGVQPRAARHRATSSSPAATSRGGRPACPSSPPRSARSPSSRCPPPPTARTGSTSQFFVGSSLAKLVVALLFIPAFYRHDCTTIYEFLRHRFGAASQVTGSLFFFVTRLLGSGVRLMAAALAVSILMGWPLRATIALFTAISIVYIAAGRREARWCGPTCSRRRCSSWAGSPPCSTWPRRSTAGWPRCTRPRRRRGGWA